MTPPPNARRPVAFEVGPPPAPPAATLQSAPPPAHRPAGSQRRYVALSDGYFTPVDSKTTIGVLRYGPSQVVAVIDRALAGRTVGEVLGTPHTTPFVASLADAMAHAPNSLLVGIANPGGVFPARWRALVEEALREGLHVVSGLHEFLGSDAGLRELADARGCDLWDLRRPPAALPVARGLARRARSLIVETIGTDCSVGKMTASLELVKSLREMGVSAEFIPTGQTGIAIAGWGYAIDALVGDFMAGAVEQMVMERDGTADVLVVEGQGSLLHPAYSGVTLALLHGAMPDVAVMCAIAGQTRLRRDYDLAIPPLPEVFAHFQSIMRPFKTMSLAGVAVNCMGASHEEMLAECARLERETGRPTIDPVRMGARRLAEAVVEALRRKRGTTGEVAIEPEE